MKVKKFTADSMAEAMKMVRTDLGNEAVILNSRVVFRGGFLGFFRKKNFEVIAAIDPQIDRDMKQAVKEKVKKVSPSLPPKEKESRDISGTIKEAGLSGFQSNQLMKEIAELKSLIKTSSAEKAGGALGYPEPIQKLQQLMDEQEISASLKDKFISALVDKWFSENIKSSNEEMLAHFQEEVTAFLTEFPFGGITFTKKFVNVIGPTGVGKTTTLAKIAADCVLNHHKKVAFITTDTYRIAAIDQLKTYAQILNIPIEVCYSLTDFQQSANKFADYDVILIDTAGRNFRNKKYVEDLLQVIDFKREMETYLVLALTAKQRDMEDIYEQFSGIGIQRFIFTKADETSVYGSLLNMIEKYKIGAAYLTTGQNVPDDMMLASPEAISKLLVGAK